MKRRTLLQGFVAAAVAALLRPVASLPAFQAVPRAAGGPVTSGLRPAYLVGESQREWWIPDRDGRVIGPREQGAIA